MKFSNLSSNDLIEINRRTIARLRLQEQHARLGVADTDEPLTIPVTPTVSVKGTVEHNAQKLPTVFISGSFDRAELRKAFKLAMQKISEKE